MTANMSTAGNFMRTELSIAYSLVMLVGLPLNALSLWIIVVKHGLRAANTVIMANLATSDLLLVLSLPLRIYLNVKRNVSLKDIPCRITTHLFRTNLLSSAFFISFISVDRMLAVAYPLRSRKTRTPRNAGVACVAVWLVSAIYCLPQLDLMNSSVSCFVFDYDANFSCLSNDTFPENLSNNAYPLFALFLVVCLVILFVVNVMSTAKVIWALHNREVDLAGHNVRKVILLFFVNTCLFVVFFLPFIIVTLWTQFQCKPNLKLLDNIICLTTFNCCVDPLVYYFSLDAFWKRNKRVQL